MKISVTFHKNRCIGSREHDHGFKISTCERNHLVSFNMSDDIKRAESPDAENRCQGVNSRGQCDNEAVQLPDGSFGANCLAHGGNKQIESAKAKSVRNYQLTQFKARVDQKLESDSIKSLREEVAILRMVLETQLNTISDENELLMCSGKIADLVQKIDKVVNSCHTLEKGMSELLDKAAILRYASTIIEILDEEIKDKDAVSRVAERMVEALGDIKNEK